MQFTPSTIRKIGVVYGILMILVVVALLVRWWHSMNLSKSVVQKTNSSTTSAIPKSPTSYVGKYSLEGDAKTYKVGEAIDVSVVFEAPGKSLDGTDVVLHFDPKVINALGFAPGTYFGLTPRKDIDNKSGTVVVTSLSTEATKPASNKVTLGIVHFQAVKEGTTEISFDFIQGGSSKTALTESKTSQNILGIVEGMKITVEP